MASVNISITKDVYDFLTEQKKGNDKSYSQIIRELKEKADNTKGSFAEVRKLYGLKINVDTEKMKQFRSEIEDRL